MGIRYMAEWEQLDIDLSIPDIDLSMEKLVTEEHHADTTSTDVRQTMGQYNSPP